MNLTPIVVIVFTLQVFGQEGMLPRSTPEAQGISSAGIQKFIEAADQQVNSMHSFMLACQGKPFTRRTF